MSPKKDDLKIMVLCVAACGRLFKTLTEDEAIDISEDVYLAWLCGKDLNSFQNCDEEE